MKPIMPNDRWTYDTAADFGLPLAERLARVPREPDLAISAARLAAAVVVRAALRTVWRTSVEGAGRLPRSGSFVLVANHASHLDTAVLLSLLPLGALDRAYPLGARDVFAANRAVAIASGVAFNVLAFDREVPACRAFESCRDLLAGDGNVLILYPEGTRSTDGRVAPFKPGVGYLLAGLDVPVVPCFVSGTAHAWPKGARFPRPGRVGVRVGEPRVYATAERTKASAVAIAEALRAAVLDLSEGAPYVHDHLDDDDRRHGAHRGALGRHSDLLPRVAPVRAGDARRRPLSPRP